jgi:hypothetical protein
VQDEAVIMGAGKQQRAAQAAAAAAVAANIGSMQEQVALAGYRGSTRCGRAQKVPVRLAHSNPVSVGQLYQEQRGGSSSGDSEWHPAEEGEDGEEDDS